MKKILLILLLLITVFALASCGKEQIDLSSYQIVVAENASATVKYSAENLSELFKDKFGITVAVVADTEVEKENEILLGETNREASKTNTSFDKMQYLLAKKDNKIVLQGNGIYIGSACGELVNEHLTATDGELFIEGLKSKESIKTYKEPTTCKNVILMIGDGMGENHIMLGEMKGGISFVAKEFPNIGISITRSQSVINGEAKFTDSAASGTAMATGYKTINGHIGIDANGNVLQNVRELAHSIGANTAILTTDKITGATPSAFLCHNSSRNNTEELQAEIDALIKDGNVNYCKGDVDNSLTEETKNALNEISKDGSQFFIMIEEGHIDKCSHDRDIEGATNMVVRFNDAIEYATQFALMHKDTALIVTADHETGNLDEKNGMFLFRSKDHTNKDVPVFAIGANTSIFKDATIENIKLAKFTAKAYSSDSFGMSLDALPKLTVISGWWLVASKYSYVA